MTPADPALCPAHGRPATAGCLTCERLCCPLCLGDTAEEDFLCPECGERGVLPLDEGEFPEPRPARADEL